MFDVAHSAPRVRYRCALAALVLYGVIALQAGIATAAHADQSDPGANPIPFAIPAIKRGKQLYTVHCVSCHGTDGRGDTEMREFLKTVPADLTDGEWTYGADARFDVIKHGRDARDMPGFADALSDERIWQIVHYIDYLGGRRP